MEVVFDPSLLAFDSEDFTYSLLEEEGKVEIFMTSDMCDILCTEKYLERILTLWDIPPEYTRRMVRLAIKICKRSRRPKPKDSYQENKLVETMKSLQTIVTEKITTDEAVAKFLSDEIALAVVLKRPILCIESSEWRIVKFLKRIGAKTRRILKLHMDQKSEFFKTEKAKKHVLAAGLGAALVFVTGGAVAGITAALGETLSIIIVDP